MMNLSLRLSQREKRTLLTGGVIILLILLFQAYSWYSDFMEGLRDLSEARLSVLQRQMERLAEGDSLHRRAETLRQQVEEQERALLKGDKPPLAAAELQRALKEMATDLGIDIKLERTLNPVEAGPYYGIPVEIGFTTTTGKLKDLLYRLRRSSLLATVTKLKVRVTDINDPREIYTTMTVTGFIRRPPGMKEGEGG